MICSRWIALALVLLTTLAAPAQVAYTVTDLGTPPGSWNTSAAYGINNAGQVAGESTTSQPGMPFDRVWRYTPGVGVVDLGSLSTPLGTSTTFGGNVINAAGQVAGSTTLPTGVAGGAFRYTDGVGMVNLGALPGHISSTAAGINNAGQVVGTSSPSGGTAFDQRAFRYTDGVGMVGLGVPAGAAGSVGRAINNSGQVSVSGFFTSSVGKAYRYTDALGYLLLGDLGGQNSVGWAINDGGQVAGSADTASGVTHAFRYTDGAGMVDLGALLPAGRSEAWGINNGGDVVGTSAGGAFLYRDGMGVTFLNAVIDPTSGWTLGTPFDINDNGWIVGTGTRGGLQRAFLLTPIPEPSSLLLAGGAALMGVATRLCSRRIVPGAAPASTMRGVS
ncbi:MAG: PEP-CTERM sorting domain-containing protein [Gemmataceae bacterium]